MDGNLVLIIEKEPTWPNSTPFLYSSKAEYDCSFILLKSKKLIMELFRNQSVYNLNHPDSDKERKGEGADDHEERDKPDV